MKRKNLLQVSILPLSIVMSFSFSFSFFLTSVALPGASDPKEVYSFALNSLNDKFYYKSKVNFTKWKKKTKDIDSYDEAHNYISKLTKSLNEPYTRFLSSEEFKDEQNIINSKLVGVGIKLAINKPIILDVLTDSPASKEDIKPNDYLVSVNGKSTRGLTNNQVLKMLKGVAESKVKICVQRENNILSKELIRKQIELKSVSSKVVEDIAILKIDSFIPENTSKLFKEELSKLKLTKGVIIDLRNNSGGLLNNAVEIADMFLKEGKIVSTVSPANQVSQIANPDELYKKNIVILVNENTASASEILAGALKDNNRATILGKKTFGKGLVQEIVKLPDDSALHVTIAKYLTPSGKDINLKGITPDEIIHDDSIQIKRAIEILTKKQINTEKARIAAL